MTTRTDSLRYDISRLMKAGSYHDIVDRCHVELTLARRENRFTVEIIALLGLAAAQCSLGHFGFARDYVNQAVESADTIRSVGLLVDALILRARIAREGYLQTAEAQEDYERAVNLAFEAGDMRRYGRALLGMGEIAAQPGESGKQAWRIIDIARELNDEQLEARAILLLANAFIRKGEHSKASDGLLVALRKAQAVKDRLLESVIIGQQGLALAQHADSFDRGIQQQLTALEVARGMEAVFHEFMRLHTLASTLMAAGKHSDALNYLDEMLALAQDVAHKPYEMYTLGILGQLNAAAGKPASARRYFALAVDAARELAHPAYEARYLYALGAVYQAQWDFTSARAQYKQARSLYLSLADGRNATRVRATVVYTYFLAFAARILKLMGMQPSES